MKLIHCPDCGHDFEVGYDWYSVIKETEKLLNMPINSGEK